MALANGIKVIGNPTGGMLYPFLITTLTYNFGLKQSFLMQAAVLSHLFVLILLIKPFQDHVRSQQCAYQKYLKKHQYEIKEEYLNNLLNECNTEKDKKKTYLEFKFLLNPAYLVFIIQALGTALALPGFLYFIPAYGRSLGFTPTQYTLLVSVQSILDVAIRPIVGWISNQGRFSKINILACW